MAQDKDELDNASFNDDWDFTPEKPTAKIKESDGTTKTHETSKIQEVGGDDDDDDDFDELVGKKGRVTPKAEVDAGFEELDEPAAKDDDEEEEEVKPKKKPEDKPKAKKVEEDDEDDDKEEKPKDKPKAKKKVETDIEVAEKDDDEEGELSDEEKELEFFTTLTEEMKEKGILANAKLKKGEKVTPDKFFEFQEEEIETRVVDTVEAMGEKLDPDGRAYLAYVMKGGKSSDYMNVLRNTITFDKFDPDNAEQVDTVIKHHLLTVEKLEGEEFDDRFKYIKDSGKAAERAQKFYDKAQAAKETAKKELQKTIDEATETARANAKKFREDLNEVIEKIEKVGTIPITKADKKDLDPYINRPVVKIGKDSYIPQINADITKILTGKSKEDKEFLIALAKVIKNRFQVKEMEVEAETKAAKKANSKLMSARTNPRATTSGNYAKRALSDDFA